MRFNAYAIDRYGVEQNGVDEPSFPSSVLPAYVTLLTVPREGKLRLLGCTCTTKPLGIGWHAIRNIGHGMKRPSLLHAFLYLRPCLFSLAGQIMFEGSGLKQLF